MKILVNNALYNYKYSFNSNVLKSKPFISKSKPSVSYDVISFGDKQYDIDRILNPTEHCAYCGCKVYNQAQIESMARELLQLKASRLEGKIKSVLEKLEDAKNAQDIAFAKRLENAEQIKFFRDFLQLAEKKSFLKGSAIFDQFFNLDSDSAFELLVKNLNPLLKTVDHISPQHESKDNKHSDINLVEACYCCNHDLKKGASFSEFYAIFPSIENNMPSDKFNYAISSVLDSSQASIMQRISAQSMLKLIERLFLQRTDAYNYLQSIDHRIQGCKTSVQDSVENCREEIAQKKDEIIRLNQELGNLMEDSEFVALLTGISLSSKLEAQKTLLDSLQIRFQRISDNINNLNNPKQNKKTSVKMTAEEKENKVRALKATLVELSSQISAQKALISDTESEINDLVNKFPTVEMLQQRKSNIDIICKAYNALSAEQSTLEQKNRELAGLIAQESELVAQLQSIPEPYHDFDASSYPQDDQNMYNSYLEMVEALKYIDEHPNGGNIKSIIKQSARKTLLQDIAELEKNDVITHYLEFSKRKILEAQLSKVRKSISECKLAIEESEKACADYEKTVSPMSLEQAITERDKLSDTIRRITEKQNKVKIPQRINCLKAEITMLESTISDLLKKAQDIDSSFNVTV